MVNEVERASGLVEQLTTYILSVRPPALGLLCSITKCQRRDRISRSKHVDLETERLRAAEKFAASGWSFQDGPVCPDCQSGRRPLGKDRVIEP
jgi:hypothetical protein